MEIETNVPVPTLSNEVFPLADLEIGHSFVVKLEQLGVLRLAMVKYQAGKPGVEYKATVGDKVGEYRVWRVS